VTCMLSKVEAFAGRTKSHRSPCFPEQTAAYHSAAGLPLVVMKRCSASGPVALGSKPSGKGAVMETPFHLPVLTQPSPQYHRKAVSLFTAVLDGWISLVPVSKHI
jgi:hypothetical protein